MVDRVHDDAAVVRAPAEPAGAAGLADRDVHVIRVRHRTDGAAATAVHQALLARVQPQDDVILVPAERAIWPPFPIFISMLWTMVPTGMLPSGMTLPGLTST